MPKTGEGAIINGNNAQIKVIRSTKKGERASEDFEKECIEKLDGAVTSDGVEIKSIHDHAMYRMEQRGISPMRVRKALENATPYTDKNPDRLVYLHKGTKVIVDDFTGVVITAIYVGKKGK